MTCIVTLFDGKKELPILGLSKNQQIDLQNYRCSCISQKDLIHLKRLCSYPLLKENASLLVEILEKGLEIHLWQKNITNKKTCTSHKKRV